MGPEERRQIIWQTSLGLDAARQLRCLQLLDLHRCESASRRDMFSSHTDFYVEAAICRKQVVYPFCYTLM